VLNKQTDLLVGIALSLLMLGLAVFNFYPPVLRAILALSFVLVLPGYAITAAIFPGQSLSGLERLLLTLGLSLTVTILSGLVLNLTPWGIQVDSWAALLSIVTLVASLAAMQRRRIGRAKIPDSAKPHFPLSVRGGLLFGISGLIVAVALGFSQAPKSSQYLQGYTTLWILPGAESQQTGISLGISNQEFDLMHYQLQLTQDGKLVKEWPDISLEPGKHWEQSIVMPVSQGLVEANLFLANNPGVVYRHVTLPLKRQGN
jgi:Protein of unknown function (DUF1616)